jgi:protoporphyrinogen oxidase
MESEKKKYIIGAGISGLIAAIELEKSGYKPTIIEAADEVGGRVKTLNANGHDLDVGFQVLLDAYPMANKYLDLKALDLIRLESGAQIYADGKTYRIGDPLRNLGILLPTLIADIGTIGDKLKILRLNASLKNKSIETIFSSPEKTTLEYLKDFGFSKRIISRFFRPFFAGIFLEPDLRTSSRMFEFVYKMFGEGHATIPRGGIGDISKQLKSKLKSTEFMLNTKVAKVDSEAITLDSGKSIEHNGVIVATNLQSIIEGSRQEETNWKSCMCLYFEVDKTNIPDKTIALVADNGRLSNNLYGYKDSIGRNILSVTVLEFKNKSEEELIEIVANEVNKYTCAKKIDFIHKYRIDQALPDISDLKSTFDPRSNEIIENVFVAGDHTLNASLNAAMESGRLAAAAVAKEE